MTHTLIGYARCSTDKQDLAAQQDALVKLGVAANRIYTDKGFTGTNRTRPGLDQALAPGRAGDGRRRLGGDTFSFAPLLRGQLAAASAWDASGADRAAILRDRRSTTLPSRHVS